MNPQNAIPRPELIVSLDRSDTSVAVALLEAATNTWTELTVSTAPEALAEWWRQLTLTHPDHDLLVAFEQPAPNLLAFFAPRRPAAIYALNPSATWAYRQSLAVSRARTDQSDARHQALFIRNHRHELTAWRPVPAEVSVLDRINQGRRKLVDQRTGLTNRLQATLKRHYPQALGLMHDDIWRPMNLAFLRRWPTPASLQSSRPATLKAFFQRHGSRSPERWAERETLLRELVPLPAADADLTAEQLEVTVIVDQVEVLNQSIARYELEIARRFASEDPVGLVRTLPGAGPMLAPRVWVALARYAGQCADAGQLAAALGVAPVTDQSGKARRVRRRLRCSQHTSQTFVEWAKEAALHSIWSKQFMALRKAQGHGFYANLRALAFKWLRILWRCWSDKTPYDETRYLEALRAKGSPLVPPDWNPPALTTQPT
jgi:transposase